MDKQARKAERTRDSDDNFITRMKVMLEKSRTEGRPIVDVQKTLKSKNELATLKELKDFIDDAIEKYGLDAKVVSCGKAVRTKLTSLKIKTKELMASSIFKSKQAKAKQEIADLKLKLEKAMKEAESVGVNPNSVKPEKKAKKPSKPKAKYNPGLLDPYYYE